MRMTRIRGCSLYGNTCRLILGAMIAALVTIASASSSHGQGPASATGELPRAFHVGVAVREITPAAPTPMWGYGARHDRLSEGTLDPLWAKAIVIESGQGKLAIVGLDLGRGPTPAMMTRIRQAVAPRGIAHLLICGSHTHHGPVIELTDQPGAGKGKFDAAVAYARALPDLIAAAILEADDHRRPARMAVAARDVGLNRNRHTKRPTRPTDPRLTVIRFDGVDDRPMAVLVHYTAHPVLTPGDLLKFSADYPGHLQRRVEDTLKVPCLFIQGAAGDQSADPPDGKRDPKSYGSLLGDHVLALVKELKTSSPKQTSLAGTIERHQFATRVNFKSSITTLLYSRSFFPELIKNYTEEFAQGMRPEVTTVLLNGELAIVGIPGEPFCQHALRLRERAYLPTVLVFGYCNGHLLYFPTIEAASEGGYGADPRVSPIAVGAGEEMMNRALINLYRFLRRFPEEPETGRKPAASEAGPKTSQAPGAGTPANGPATGALGASKSGRD